MKRFFIVMISTLLAAVTPVCAEVSLQTLDNLNSAYQGESNAARRYEAYSKKAQAEGNAYAARLFRATAMAETIHRESFKAAIVALGGQVKEFKLEAVKVGATNENLQAAIKGEAQESETLYPSFVAQAKKDGAKQAVRSFLQAQKVEAGHVNLYKEALDSLDKNIDLPVYVCKVCGNIVNRVPLLLCPVCHEGRNEYQQVQ